MVNRKKTSQTSPEPPSKSTYRPFTDLGKANRVLESIYKIVHVITAKGVPYEKQLQQNLQILLDYLGVEQGSIMILEKKNLVVKAASRQSLVGRKQPLQDASVATWVAHAKKPLFVPDITKDKRFKNRSGGAYKKNALLSAPITQGDKLIGVINVSDKSGHTDFFQDDIAYMLNFSSLVLSLIVQEDLTEKTRRQRNTLRKRNQELRHQEDIRSELTRMLIHDLKGPLSEVVANLDILSYSVDEQNKEFVESAHIGCDRAVRMADNLGTIGKIEDGKQELIKREVSPASLLEETISSVKGLARLKEIQVNSELPADLPAIKLDRIIIIRVMQNLIMNAMNYAPAGSSITLGCRFDSASKQFEFYIADQGPGVPEDEKTLIFDKYVRLQHRMAEQTGTGLGLYFCKLAVEMHRGQINVENLPGQGSRFYFTLPLQ